MDSGHWIVKSDFEPTEWFGFIYRIVDKTNGMEYIGKKQLGSTKRKIVKNRKNRKIVKSESKWKKYTSSSTHLNDAIKEKGIENFTFIIESLHKTKASLHYREVELQIYEDVLRAKLPNGNRKYYNAMIANMRFLVPDRTAEEAEYMNSAKKPSAN